jgi:glycosyltransferase involved in cell wall biosynthesis
VTVHDIAFFLFPQYHPLKRKMLFRRLFSPSMHKADHVIADSQNTKQDLIKHFHVSPEKITVIYLAAEDIFRPVEIEDAQTVISKYGLEYGQFLLYVGTIEPRKNLMRLLKAYNVFRTEGSNDVPLVLAGASGWLNDGLFRAIQDSAWSKDIRVLGYLSKADLPALYSGALAFIYPSLYEGFGLPPLEAMACGAPVITSNNSSLPEVVGDAAILVNPLSAEEIAEAVLRLAGDPSLREKMREKGLQRARSFSWEVSARKTIEVYEKTLG